MNNPSSLAERLFTLADSTSNQLYSAELGGFPHLFELTGYDGFGELNYGPDLSPWIVYSPEWSKYSFAFLSDGAIIVCSGAENSETAKKAINNCLETLFVSEHIGKEDESVASVESVELDAELPEAVTVDFSEEWSIAVDHDLRREKKIQQTLVNGPVDVLEVQEFNSDRPVPVVYQEERLYLGSRQYEYSRSPDENCTVAYSLEEVLLFTKEEVTARIQATRLTTAAISNTGIAIVGGDLSEPDSPGDNRGTEEFKMDIGVGAFDQDEASEEIAVYSLYGEQLHHNTVTDRIIDSDISGDGNYAAILTGTYETSYLRIYEVEDWALLSEHKTRDEHPSPLGELKEKVQIMQTDAGYQAYLSETADDDPTYAVNLDGDIVWKTDERVLAENIEPLLTKIENPDENIPSLKGNYETRSEAIRRLETIASRHPTELQDYVDRLVTILEENKVPTTKKREEPREADSSTVLLFGHLGRVPESIRPHLTTLSSLVQHSPNPTVKQAASDCLKSAAKESDEVSKALVPHLASGFETAPVSIKVIRIFETQLGELLIEQPSRSDTIAEQIRLTTNLDKQKELFRVLKKNISLNQPEEVREPLAAPVAKTYIELVDEYIEASNDSEIGSRSYARALHGDVKTVLERVIDTQLELFADLTQPLLDQCLAARKADSYASPGDPSGLLQLGCVLAESTLQDELNQARSKVNSVVSQTDELASVDILLCIGDEWARNRLKKLASKTPRDSQNNTKSSHIQERAVTALSVLDSDKEIDPAIDEIDAFTTRTDTIRTNVDLLTKRVMELRLQYCYKYLQEVGSAMRSDFEGYVAEKEQNIIGDFEAWWDQVRDQLKQLPGVQLDGHTYSYTGEDE